jgi:hypothetical protein
MRSLVPPNNSDKLAPLGEAAVLDFEARALLNRGLNWGALFIWTLALALLSLAVGLLFP